MVIEKLQPIFDARSAVGYLCEIVLPQRLLIFEAERTVIGGDHLQMIVLQSLPQFRRMILLAQWRRKYIFGALKAGPRQLLDREQQVLRAGFGENRDAPVARR